MILKALLPILLIAAIVLSVLRLREPELGTPISNSRIESRRPDHLVNITESADSDFRLGGARSPSSVSGAIGNTAVIAEQQGRQTQRISIDPLRRNAASEVEDNSLIDSAGLKASDLQMGTKTRESFPISDAVLASCESLEQSADPSDSSSRADPSCAELRKYLSVFDGEERNHAWAVAMEEKLLTYIASAPKECKVRMLECRETVCAFECESVDGPLFGYDPALAEHLRFVDSMFGYERDAAGVRLTVTLALYVRR